MNVKQIVEKNRSYRRFYQDHKISKEDLCELVDLARLSASGANLQGLKYILSSSVEMNEKIFANLAWAGYLKDWDGPEEGEKPSGYIVVVLDREICKSCVVDQGISAQSILLGAVEKGLGGCIFLNIKRPQLCEALDLDERYELLQVIAIGKPKEDVRIVPLGEDGSIRYYRDEAGVHYVPKRSLDDIIIG